MCICHEIHGTYTVVRKKLAREESNLRITDTPHILMVLVSNQCSGRANNLLTEIMLHAK